MTQSLLPAVKQASQSTSIETQLGQAGVRALALVMRNPLLRQATMTGVAFGIGYYLSRSFRPGELGGITSSLRDVYRVRRGNDPAAGGRLVGRWVRETITVFALPQTETKKARD